MQTTLSKEAEILLCDLDNDRNEAIKFLQYAVGENELLKVLKELHIEAFKRLQVMKQELIKNNDELRKKGVSFNERRKLLGEGKLEWIEARIDKLRKVKLRLPPFESFVSEFDLERIQKHGHREYMRFLYQLGYFQ